MRLRTLTLTTALLASSSLAHALEGKAVLDQLLNSPALSEAKITWDTLQEENSSSFTLLGVKIKGKRDEELTIDTVNVRGLTETGGVLRYDSITLGNIKGDAKRDGDYAISGIATTDGALPYALWTHGLKGKVKRERIKLGNFTLSGLAVYNKGVKLSLDSVVLVKADIPLDYRYKPDSDVDGEPAAPLTFDQFAVSNLNGSQEAVTYEMGSMTISDAHIPTSLTASTTDWMKIYSAVSINNIKAALGTLPVFALDSLSGTISPPDDEGTISTRSNMDGLMINIKAHPDPKVQAIADQLGYDKVEGSMTGVGTYNPTTGRMAIMDTALKLKDMFNLSIDYSITGYTQEVAQKLAAAQMQMAAGKSQQEAFAAILGELGGVKLEGLKVGLTDKSLVGKLLDFQGKQMGTTGEQLAQGAPMMIGIGMGQLQMPALTEMVTAAVGKFLKERGTISVEAAPSEPVPILNLVLSGQADPKTLPGLLNLQVSAQ